MLHRSAGETLLEIAVVQDESMSALTRRPTAAVSVSAAAVGITVKEFLRSPHKRPEWPSLHRWSSRISSTQTQTRIHMLTY